MKKVQYPWLTAKCHVFEHNWHEIIAYHERMLSLGVDEVLFLKAFSNGIYATGRAGTEKAFNVTTLQWEETQKGQICPHMWSEEVHLDYDGGVMPCGSGCREEHTFVTAEEAMAKSLTDQLNCDAFLRVRKFFLGKASVKREDLPILCRDCEYTRMYRGDTPRGMVRS